LNCVSLAPDDVLQDVTTRAHLCSRMILSENRWPPRIKRGAGFSGSCSDAERAALEPRHPLKKSLAGFELLARGLLSFD